MQGLHTPGLSEQLRGVVLRLRAAALPRHAYPEQYSRDMDCPEVDWAKRFILIASTPRSGSHYLGHMIGETGNCGVPLEYLNDNNARYWAGRFGTDRIDRLFPLFVRYRTTPNGTFTVKAHWSHLWQLQSEVAQMTRGLGFEKVLWISRKNQLSQAVSTVIASQTGVWISGAKPRAAAHYDYEAIAQAAKELRHANNAWRSYTAEMPESQCMQVTYEDLLSDPALPPRIASFLDLDKELHPSARTQKQGNSINQEWKDRFASEIRDEHRWILDPPAWRDN